MLNDYNTPLRSAVAPQFKPMKKLGTLKIGIVEATPVVWQGRLIRFEWVRNHGWGRVDGTTRDVGCYHFVDMQTEAETPDFAYDHSFGCAYTENGIMYVHGTRGPGGGNVIDTFVSKDLINWEQSTAITLDETVNIYNTSVCKGADGYIMAIEIGGKDEMVGKAFTMIFAKSRDLINWELLPTDKCVYDKARYTACPSIRYYDGYYYMVYLEALPLHRYLPYIVRTRDLENYELGLINPIMMFDEGDRILKNPERFSKEQIEYIKGAVDCNNSDLDFCDYNGKTVILYSWGNQYGKEFLAEAEWNGTEKEFLQSFFQGITDEKNI